MYEFQANLLPLAIPAIERFRLMRYIEGRVGTPDAGADLMEDVLEQVLQAKSPQLIQDPIRYLYGIARTAICDSTKVEMSQARVMFDSDLAGPIAEQLPDVVRDARAAEEALAAQIDSEQALEQAIEGLPSTHRRVLVMTTRDGLTYVQAAKALKLSLHTLKKYAHQARARLRMRLDPLYSPDRGEPA